MTLADEKYSEHDRLEELTNLVADATYNDGNEHLINMDKIMNYIMDWINSNYTPKAK